MPRRQEYSALVGCLTSCLRRREVQCTATERDGNRGRHTSPRCLTGEVRPCDNYVDVHVAPPSPPANRR